MIVCCDALYLLKTLPDNYIDLLLTDIPYNEVNRKSAGLRTLDKGTADILNIDLEELCLQFIRVCKGSFYIFCGIEQVSDIKRILRENKLITRLCIWEKNNPGVMNGDKVWLSGVETCIYAKKSKATFNEHCKNTVWKYPVVKNSEHPTPKPVKLFEYLVKTSSNEGDLVMDPFCGGGTTALACKNTNRRFLCGDKELKWCQISRSLIL